jgi:hypothetical protein
MIHNLVADRMSSEIAPIRKSTITGNLPVATACSGAKSYFDTASALVCA